MHNNEVGRQLATLIPKSKEDIKKELLRYHENSPEPYKDMRVRYIDLTDAELLLLCYSARAVEKDGEWLIRE